MIAFLKLIRYKNLLMVLLTMVLTKYALIESFILPSFSDFYFSIVVISVLLIAAAGYIVNDIYDVEADIINKPNKVFINGIISKKNAWNLYFIFNIIGLILSLYILKEKQIISISLYFICPIFLLFIYSKYLKKIPFTGNILIAFLIPIVILLLYELQDVLAIKSGLFTSLDLSIVIFDYLIFSFLTTLIREIIKDIEDINGDLKIKAKTLPIVIGRKRASHVAFFFGCILLVFLLMVLQTIKQETLFLSYGILFILLPLLYFLYLLWKAEKKKDFSYLSNLMKLIMFLGILSMLLFKID